MADKAEDMGAIENLLRAIEGMQSQVQALTDLVIEQDKRIKKLERLTGPLPHRKLIQVRN